jgi:hypothetical protein
VRPVERVPARAELVFELRGVEDLGLPYKPKKSQAGKGQAGAARGIQRSGLPPPRRHILCSFFYFQNPDGKNWRAQVKRYAHSQLAIRLCCHFLNPRTALLILLTRAGYEPIGCIVCKRGSDIRQLGQGSAEHCQPSN